MAQASSSGAATGPTDFDVVVVGAGFAGLYQLHKLRQLGFSVRVIEAAGDVGGTWYWNRYPGARCDIPTTDYSYSFDPALESAWTWSEKYATQPEILRYAQFVAERYDLRRDIDFNTRLEAAHWHDGDDGDASTGRWLLHTDTDKTLRCQHLVMCSGCLSLPKAAEIEGADRFKGEVYFTSRWPHAGVDFSGKRVAVIGTGSSGIQSIPIIAGQARQLTVFQRTANFSIPAGNGPVRPERLAPLQADRDAYRQAARWSRAGVPNEPTQVMGRFSAPALQRERFEAAWQTGELIPILGVFADQILFPEANAIVAGMLREKIRSVVQDPQTAALLSPQDHPFGTKRPCLDTGYYATFNQPHVRLIDLRSRPIQRITESGIELADETMSFDAIVYATGFDAMTGAVVAVDITGRDGQTLKQKWAQGPTTYLGLMNVGFPNLFTITGPGSPSVLSNMMVSIEQHVEWVANCLAHLRSQGLATIEPTPAAEAGWVTHVNDCANITLFPSADSWYMGANVPGKPRVFLPYVGGVDAYRQACDEVVAAGYLGLSMSGPQGSRCQDGVVRRLQPDMAMVLQMMAGMGLPSFDSLPVDQARGLLAQLSAARPPGPEVGEIVDGSLPGPSDSSGALAWRLYRPASPGPHPVVVYFHGGGWVLGSQESDDPLCRDLCQRSGALIVSVDYRHAPEARFPAAADDGLAAVRWVAAHAAELGGIPGPLAVAGWSAGANVAAVACQSARDAGGPAICGQLLLTPVTDCKMDTPSYVENADGYVLTADLMRWFWDHYADPADRSHPKASPLRAADLSGLPPAFVMTAQFDPLRDEGIAYAQALAAAGVPVQQTTARGHTHTSMTMVDVVVSGVGPRAEMGRALRGFFKATVPA